ncbi:MAG: FliI/YscN family ATPase [Myxococcota bacterium]|nr:FliI/YscN family ATPase [Myxococcota bacterium]
MSLGLGGMGAHLDAVPLVRRRGRVVQVVGTVIEADLPGVAVGELTEIGRTLAEVIGFRGHRALLMPLGSLEGVSHGSAVRVRSTQLTVAVGPGLLGRVVDPLGQPMDGRPLTNVPGRRGLQSTAPDPMKRHLIESPLPTGVRALDGLLTVGTGQRVAVMAGSGVGKSTLMGMVAKNAKADVNVVALIGERGREVREFLERDLGPTGLARSVVVLATSDASPVLQVKAMSAALAIAEHFRDEGQRVLMMVDSLTRLAMAQRQIGLSAGEPPTTKGYTPSVFSMMPRLLERAGPGAGSGSITGLFTVLVEGDDMDDPVADTVRGIVDGHIVLSRKLASHGHYPAIDILQSVSRTMPSTVSPEQVAWANRVRALIATYRENEELIRLGAYKAGTDPEVDAAIQSNPTINAFLRQAVDDATDWNAMLQGLGRVAVDGAARGEGPVGVRRARRGSEA